MGQYLFFWLQAFKIFLIEDNFVWKQNGGKAGNTGHDDVVVRQAGQLHQVAHHNRQTNLC